MTTHQQFVGYNSQTEDVATCVSEMCISTGLFRAHIRRCSHVPVSLARITAASQAKVSEEWPTFCVDKNVGWLDVAMDNIIAVSASPGMPRARSGIIAAAGMELLADSEAIKPSGAPFPNFSGVFDVFWAKV